MDAPKHHVIPIPNKALPFLSGAVKLRGPRGMCFHRSVALCLDLPGSDIVIATLRGATEEELEVHPEWSTVPFIHAWVEYEDKLMAPTTIEERGGLVFMRPQQYYDVCGASDIRRLSRKAMVEHVVDRHINRQLLFGIDPPWQGHLVDRLLNAVGVKYLISDRGGVIPVTSRN